MMRYRRQIIYVAVVIAVIVVQFFLQQRYTTLLQGGGEYQWFVKLERTAEWIPSDYLQVIFHGARAPWTGERPPQKGQVSFVLLAVQPSGLVRPTAVAPERPVKGDYIEVRISKYEGGIASFDIPFNRVKIDIKKVDPAFYQSYRGTLTATMKLRDGKGVLTGIYSGGVPLATAVPEPEEKQIAQEEERIKSEAAVIIGERIEQ